MNLNRMGFSLVVMASALALLPVHAAPPSMNLSKSPLFINGSVDPNLAVTFDDSGSMNWGFLPDAVDDAICSFRRNRYYSSSFNKIYYDPNSTYVPPLRADGTRYPDADFNAARNTPFDAATHTTNLGTGYRVVFDEDEDPDQYIRYDATRTLASGLAAGSCGTNPPRFAFPVGAAEAFYCTRNNAGTGTTDADYDCVTVPAAQRQNFANWYTYYRTRANALKSAVSRSFGTLDDNIRLVWQNMRSNQLAGTSAMAKFDTTTRTNFFDWLFRSPENGNTPTLTSTKRVGEFFTRSASDATNPYWDVASNRELSCRQNFHVLVTDGFWNEDAHPPVGSAFAGNNAVITAKTLPDGVNYSLSSPHTPIFRNEAARGNYCKNNDGDSNTALCVPSYSDIAFHYWSTDLRPGLTNNVARFLSDRTRGVTGAAGAAYDPEKPFDTPEIYFNPVNDPANWQHLVQYFIGFGIDGSIANTPANYDALRRGNLQWSTPKNLSVNGVDDSWHAALSSRGKYFSASDPNALVNSLSDILNNIVARRATGSALTVSSGIIASDSLSFQTRFDGSDWSGTVLARTIDKDFNFGTTPVWDANCDITGGTCTSGAPSGAGQDWSSSRRIITSNAPTGINRGVAFRWGDLSAAQQAVLSINPVTNAVDALGQDRLRYLRGDRSGEASRGGIFRNRNSVLGAIVHSSAAVVGPPGSGYDTHEWPSGAGESRANYRAFRLAQANRAKTIYVGANDGMLHALDASVGASRRERWAYVPYAAYPKLNKLTNPQYNFEPTVDNTPAIRDVYYGGAWHTVLVGSLRRGGQGIFALDVTNPELAEGDARARVLWEFNDISPGGADLGYTYGQPFITRLGNDSGVGDWVALVPGGYYSHEADASTGSGNAVLFVIRISDGTLLKKFDLGAIDSNAYGLAAPTGIDQDRNDITEYAYAGDLAGNIWRFNLQGSGPAAWSASKLYAPTTPFARPITAQPRAMLDPQTRMPMILVGTGKFIELNDRSPSIPAQGFLSVIETFDTSVVVTEANLAKRSVQTVVTRTGGRFRSVGALSGAVQKGWQIEFSDAANAGERVIASAAIRVAGNRVIFTTMVPSGSDPCVPGGKSFVMVVNASTGGTPKESAAGDDGGSSGGFSDMAIFDTNKDGKINDLDDNEFVGKELAGLAPGAASVLPPGGGEGGIITPSPEGTDGSSNPKPDVTRVSEFEWRRRGWNELFPKR